MKKRIYIIVVGIFLVCSVILLILHLQKRTYHLASYDDAMVSIKEVSNELTFAMYTRKEWDTFFQAEKKDVLTYDTLARLLEHLGVSSYIDIKHDNSKKAVERAEWNEVYRQILDFLDTDKTVLEQNFFLLETMDSKDGCILMTNEGDYEFAQKKEFLDCWNAYTGFFLDGKCIGIASKSDEASYIKNVYVKSYKNQKLSFLYGGSDYEIAVPKLEEEAPGVCDLEWKGGSLSKISKKEDTIEGELLSYDENEIEIKDYGRISHDGKLPVYKVYGEVEEKSLSDIILGNMKAEYVVSGDEICAVLLGAPAQIEKIRVLLLAEDGTPNHPSVFLKASSDCSVTCQSTKENLAAGTVVSAEDWKLKESGATLCIEPLDQNTTITLCDANGNEISNPYQGRIEVRSTENGFTIVNELPLEQYLYAVVPSEMPSSFENQALCAQAVCARSYAYMQLMRADYASYGAHIDDSTSYQVYNKSPKTEQSVEAVDATTGQVILYQGNVAEAYYFSTSCGYTDDILVWNRKDDGTYGYLRKNCLNQTNDVGDLSEEETFRNYIRSYTAGYDSEIKFFRWRAEASFKGKEAELFSVLKTRKSVAPENILYYNSDGVTERENLDEIGSLQSVATTQRSSSGSILCLRLTFEHGIVDVKTEYNIRRILGVGLNKIAFADESESQMTILPSAFCAVIPVEDGSYVIYGGGYGHGLGMSQNGANGLAKEGKTYPEILNFFYQNIELANIYDTE